MRTNDYPVPTFIIWLDARVFARACQLADSALKVYHKAFANLHEVSMTAQTNRRFLLAKRPVGAVTRDDFSYEQVPVGEPADGQILVKNLYLSLDPAMRGWMNEGKSYIPPVGLGQVMRALGVGEVGKQFGLRITKPDGSRLKVDEPLIDPLWDEFAKLRAPDRFKLRDALKRLDAPIWNDAAARDQRLPKT